MPLLICREIKVIKNPNETADLLILCLLLQIIFMSKIAINNELHQVTSHSNPKPHLKRKPTQMLTFMLKKMIYI